MTTSLLELLITAKNLPKLTTTSLIMEGVNGEMEVTNLGWKIPVTPGKLEREYYFKIAYF